MDKKVKGLYEEGFGDRLFNVLDDLRDRFFGLTHDAVATKTIKRDKSNEALIEALCCYEKQFSNETCINEHLDIYGFLKLVLEEDAPLFKHEEYLFGSVGIKRDRSGMSVPQKNAIAVQSAAQVLWSLEKSDIPTIEKMREQLLDKENPFYCLMNLGRFISSRTIEDWVSEVFPVPENARKGRPSLKHKDLFENLVPIPGIFLKDGLEINFPKLHFVLHCLTRVLEALGWSLEQILESEFIRLYARALNPIHSFSFCIKEWIREAFLEKGSIFPS